MHDLLWLDCRGDPKALAPGQTGFILKPDRGGWDAAFPFGLLGAVGKTALPLDLEFEVVDGFFDVGEGEIELCGLDYRLFAALFLHFLLNGENDAVFINFSEQAMKLAAVGCEDFEVLT